MVVVKIWVEIDEERLAGNLGALNRVLASEMALLAVVKANAYGHGIAACTPMLARAGAKWLGVTDAQEGAAVRQALAGIARAVQPRILVMSGMMGLPEEAELIVREELTAVIWDGDHLELLARAARRGGGTAQIPVHLEVDTGMTRQGVACGDDLARILDLIAATSELRLDGVFTHFASTEVAYAVQTYAQKQRFAGAMAQVAASGLRPEWVHVGNSSFIDNGAEPGALDWLGKLATEAGARSMVRAGLALYGYLLPIEGAEGEDAALVRSRARPVMAWKTRVIGVREVEAGATVGYNGIFIAERRMRLALLPVGYADGLRRELSGSHAAAGGWVMIHGQKAPIVGRVSMNLTVVDVSGVSDIRVGDEVTLLGDGVTAEDHARLAGTIAYEILCGVRVRD